MKFTITFSKPSSDLIEELLKLGIYGRNRSDVVRRLTESALQAMVIDKFTKVRRTKRARESHEG